MHLFLLAFHFYAPMVHLESLMIVFAHFRDNYLAEAHLVWHENLLRHKRWVEMEASYDYLENK